MKSRYLKPTSKPKSLFEIYPRHTVKRTRVGALQTLLILAALCLPSWAHAVADGPDTWRVTLISTGGELNVRKGPSTQFSIVGTLPYNATGLENRGCYPQFTFAEWGEFTSEETRIARELRWCRISLGNISGWVSAQYLRE